MSTTLVAVLAFSVTAFASTTRTYQGTAAGGAVRFKAVVHHGEFRRVKEFHWVNVPIQCDEGRFETSGHLHPGRVNDRGKFRVSFPGGRVKGKFYDAGRKARGFIHDDVGQFHHCGKVHWRAHRV